MSKINVIPNYESKVFTISTDNVALAKIAYNHLFQKHEQAQTYYSEGPEDRREVVAEMLFLKSMLISHSEDWSTVAVSFKDATKKVISVGMLNARIGRVFDELSKCEGLKDDDRARFVELALSTRAGVARFGFFGRGLDSSVIQEQIIGLLLKAKELKVMDDIRDNPEIQKLLRTSYSPLCAAVTVP